MKRKIIELKPYKRVFAGPTERLQNLFFQIILHEFKSYLFTNDDWLNFSRAYGYIFYNLESLWFAEAIKFEGFTKNKIIEYLESDSVNNINELFKYECVHISDYLQIIDYNPNHAYIELIDINDFTLEKDINLPITEAFTNMKGNFKVIEHEPNKWLFNAIDIHDHVKSLSKMFDSLTWLCISCDLIDLLTNWLIYTEEDTFSPLKKVAGEQSAVADRHLNEPALLSWPLERIIFLIEMQYRNLDNSKLNPDSIHRAINRLKKS